MRLQPPTIRKLTDRERLGSKLLLGAAVGTGMAARSAARGGADLLLALNAGKFRSMGAPSIASLLPLRDSNQQVLEFAASEILGSVEIPVFFGASAFDPRQSLDVLLDRIAGEGFAGVVNFPTSIFLSGGFREQIEMAGVGFSRELDLLRRARARGLLTIGYVHTRAEAKQMASAGVDIINLNLGWNSGGKIGISSSITLHEAAEFARLVVRTIRQISPDCVCMIEGGPIVDPDDMYFVAEEARADGYIGGSTIDRIPLETFIEQITSAFKAVGVLKKRVQELENEIGRVQRDFGMIGNSDAIKHVQQQISRLGKSRLPLLVSGGPGSGKKQVARAIHLATGQKPSAFHVVGSDDFHEGRLFGFVQLSDMAGTKIQLGRFEVAGDVTIYFDEIGKIPLPTQGRILEMIEKGTFRRVGENVQRPFHGRVVFGSSKNPEMLLAERKIDPRLEYLLAGRHIAVPPLSERLDDIPMLAQSFLKDARSLGYSRAANIDGAAYRMLMTHSWPGNVRELRSIIDRAVTAAGEAPVVALSHLPPLEQGGLSGPTADERSWILDGLRKNKFRRSETAHFLGISRKTLYNKMKLYDLPLASRSEVQDSGAR